jgi:hypothetical protein
MTLQLKLRQTTKNDTVCLGLNLLSREPKVDKEKYPMETGDLEFSYYFLPIAIPIRSPNLMGSGG